MSNQTIPRVVHQIWVGKISPNAKQTSQILDTKDKLEREGIAHSFWTNENYPSNLSESIVAYASACRQHTNEEVNYGAFEADALRYFLMFQQGGLYLDCDYNLVRPIGELMDCFDHRPVFARLWPHRKSWPCNAFLASPPKHPFFRTVIDCLNGPPAGKPYYIGPAWLGARLSEFHNEPISGYDNTELSNKGLVNMLDEAGFLLKSGNNPLGFMQHQGWYTWRKRPISTQISSP